MEEIALDCVAAAGSAGLQLIRCFHPLGHDFQSQAVRHGDYGAGNLLVAGVRREYPE